MTMNDRFDAWFRGDAAACHFAAMLWDAVQEWDDLHDEGKCADANALLSWLAFGKEYSPFFLQHAHILRPVLLSTYLQWIASNDLDHGGPNDVAKSYMLRAGVYGVWHVMAWIIGGHDWAAQCGPEIYRSYGETPAEILKEMTCPTP